MLSGAHLWLFRSARNNVQVYEQPVLSTHECTYGIEGLETLHCGRHIHCQLHRPVQAVVERLHANYK